MRKSKSGRRTRVGGMLVMGAEAAVVFWSSCKLSCKWTASLSCDEFCRLRGFSIGELSTLMSLNMGVESGLRSDFLLAGVGFRFLMPVDAPTDLLGFFLPRLGGLSSASFKGTAVLMTSVANFLFFDGLEL